MTPWIEKFFKIADVQPDHPAVVTDAATVSYGQLAARVRQIAAHVKPHLEQAKVPAVVIALPQGADAYAAMLATLMAGGFYVPLNLASPAQKITMVLEQVNPAVVMITDETPSPVGGGLGWGHTCSISEIEQANLPPGLPPAGGGAPHRLAYVMFTSGSTGVPKGVMISQEALSHYVGWVQENFAPTPQDRWAQHPNIAFDVSVTDIYGALMSGGTLYPIVSERDRMLPAAAIQKYAITIWNSVPSVVNLMIQARQATRAMLSSVRLFNFLGEPLLPEQVEAIFAARPDVAIQNTYGPTEATVSCTAIRLYATNWKDATRNTVALGPAIPGMQLHVEDGELVLMGAQLADGYWQNQEKTDAAFQEFNGVRGYRTGDLVEMRGEHMFFQMRKDRQVKIHGYRVELEEIASALRKCGFVSNAVIAHGQELVAFIEHPTAPDVAALTRALSTLLEPYAIPKYFVARTALLRNANDKIDAKAMLQEWLQHKESAYGT